jgi:hypothetical protein
MDDGTDGGMDDGMDGWKASIYNMGHELPSLMKLQYHGTWATYPKEVTVQWDMS